MLFNEQKTAQMAVYFLKQQGGKMNKLKLMKLLYLAERESLLRHGMSMTGDYVVSMDHGMVLSKTLDLARETAIDAHQDGWYAMIARNGQYDLELTSSSHHSDLDELSQADRGILKDIWDRFGPMDQWTIRHHTHTLPEWKNPHGTSISVPPKELLKILGYSENEAEELSKQREKEEMVDETFQSL